MIFGGTALAGVAAKWLWPVLAPFLVGLLVAVIFDPVVDGMERRLACPRKWAVPIILCFVILCMGILTIVGSVRLVKEWQRLTLLLPDYQRTLSAFLTRFFPKSTEPGLWLNNLFWRGVMGVANGTVTLIRLLPRWLSATVVAFLSAYFFIRDKRLLLGRLLRELPKAWRPKTVQTVSRLMSHLTAFLRAQCLLAFTTFLVSLIWLLAAGQPYAWTLALLAGFLELVPLVGPALLYLPWALGALLTGQQVVALSVGLLLGTVVVVRQVLESKLISNLAGLHPLIILMAMYAGYSFFGGVGVIMGPFLGLLAKTVWGVLALDEPHGGIGA